MSKTTNLKVNGVKRDVFPSNFEREAVEKFLADEGITNAHIESTRGSNSGDNYVGVILRVTVEGIKNGKDVAMVIIYKTAPNDPKRRPVSYAEELFEREIYVYENIHPMLVALEDHFDLPQNIRICFPNCYKTIPLKLHEGLFLEDYCAKGYRMANRLQSFDWPHVEVVINMLARLHGLSYVYKAHDPETFATLTKNMEEVVFCDNHKNYKVFLCENGIVDSFFKKAINSMLKIDMADKLKIMNGNKIDMMRSLSSSKSAGDSAVLCHGDCWTNNFLFKYNEVNEPSELCLIDWQMSRYASPLTDLMHLIWTSTDENFRSAHYDRTFVHYHTKLGEYLKNFSLDIENIYDRKSFLDDRKKYSSFGLFWAAICLPNTTAAAATGNTTPVTFDAVTKAMKDNTLSDCQSNDLYTCRINSVVNDFHRLGYI